MKNLAILITTLLCVLFLQDTFAFADFTVETANAPEDNLSLTVHAIESAKQSIDLNIYELTSPEIVNALLDRIQAGVAVQIIEEGQPVGGLSAAAKGIQSQLLQSMASANNSDQLFEMTSKAGGKRRFRFDHAKYIVVDNQALLISSENYSPTGEPEPGTKGNRGWEVFIHDSGISSQFQSMFTADSDTSSGDILNLTSGQQDLYSMKLATHPFSRFDSNPSPAQAFSATSVQKVTSPDNSLSAVEDLLNNARTSIDIEEMTFDSNWGRNGGTSPVLSAVIAAAKRGVKVRVLLNDENVFNHAGNTGDYSYSKPKNVPTANTLNALQNSEGLDIAARIANLKAMGVTYIHNKGVLVDGNLTLVSSINWDENSFQNNRETGVLITSSGVYGYFESLFEKDWEASSAQSQTLAFLQTTGSQKKDDGCPEKLHIVADIGDLTSEIPQDSGFSSIANKEFQGDFVRSHRTKSCTLIERSPSAASDVSKRRFVQIRTRNDGSRFVLFEGYTSKGKLYSVRAKIPSDSDLDGTWDASVYDGSAPFRGELGSATLSLADEDSSSVLQAGDSLFQWRM